MRVMTLVAAGLLFAAPAAAQSNWFQPTLLERPDVKAAIQSVDGRSSAIVDEWIKLVEIPAPSKKEQARAEYIKAEMQKLGLSDIRVDDMSNVSGVRKGTGGGPSVVFCAHMDTVFPDGTDLKVKREGDTLRAPGIGDDTSNLMAVLETFRALDRGGVKTKGDLIFLASVQEEIGLLGARHWLETSGYKPDMFIAADISANEVWYGALRVTQYKFFYTSPGAHTLESRGGPSPAQAVAKAIDAVYAIPLPPVAQGLDTFKLPVANVGMLGGGTVFNAVPREAWFTVDLRSLDTPTQQRLQQAVEDAARNAAEQGRWLTTRKRGRRRRA
jgi:acetylornithine deacetylase/succinyl-diaminopimelate desuccinylase-like protein